MKPIFIYLIIIAVMSLISFFLYGKDKRLAQRKEWRIPEKTLLGSGLFGGALGSLIGMYTFRHKTKHWYFNVLNVIFLAIHIVIGYLIYTKLK